jgi:hypothetical protein
MMGEDQPSVVAQAKSLETANPEEAARLYQSFFFSSPNGACPCGVGVVFARRLMHAENSAWLINTADATRDVPCSLSSFWLPICGWICTFVRCSRRGSPA